MTKNAPKFAFYYLLSLVALIFMAIATGQIIFQLINKFIMDPFSSYGADFSTDVLKFAISAIIIATPIFYIISNLIYKSLFSGKLEKDAGIRRWLSYLILFASAVIIIVFLIVTIIAFLNGELTGKFILKMLTVILISATVFTFYLYDVRRPIVEKVHDKIIKLYFICSLFIVIATFAASLFIVESPTQSRNRRIDEKIVSSFYNIENDVNYYYQANKKLPDNIEIIKNTSSYKDSYQDPESKAVFVYKITGTTTYDLCANFRTSNKGSEGREYIYIEESKRHEAGQNCLNFRLYLDNVKDIPAAVPAPIN